MHRDQDDLLLVGLAVGFGGGVYWGVKYPTQAAVAAEEEQRFIEAQKSLLEKTKRASSTS